MELDEQLLVEEYKSCRELILKNIDIMEKNAVYVTGACALIFVFSLQANGHIVSVIAALLPPVIACLGWWRFRGLNDVIDKINGYLAKLEKSHPPLNWTTYYLTHHKYKALRRAVPFYLTIWHE
jgi:hypothetical protein